MRSIGTAAMAVGMALVVGAGLAATATAGPPAPVVPAAVLTATTDQDLAADLAGSREEERMARDLYTLFGQTYPAAPVFDRIAASEQQHFDAVGALLTTYGVPDPSAGLPAGTYADPEVQALYDGWKAQGLESQEAALAVGVALEQADIADLEALLARNPEADVQQVFNHLLQASRHHLAAFTADDGGSACDGTGPGTGAGMGAGMGAATGGAGGTGTDPRGVGMGMGRLGR